MIIDTKKILSAFPSCSLSSIQIIATHGLSLFSVKARLSSFVVSQGCILINILFPLTNGSVSLLNSCQAMCTCLRTVKSMHFVMTETLPVSRMSEVHLLSHDKYKLHLCHLLLRTELQLRRLKLLTKLLAYTLETDKLS